jgi:hypothetical protein
MSGGETRGTRDTANEKDCRSGMPNDRACSPLHLHGEWSLLRMAGGQCPPKGGQLTTTTPAWAIGESIDHLIDH